MEENPKSQENISASSTRNYDSLPDKQIVEVRAWREFAARQIADKPSDQSAALKPSVANLKATPILDFEDAEIRDFTMPLKSEQKCDRQLLQQAHRLLHRLLKPVYSLDELQSAS